MVSIVDVLKVYLALFLYSVENKPAPPVLRKSSNVSRIYRKKYVFGNTTCIYSDNEYFYASIRRTRKAKAICARYVNEDIYGYIASGVRCIHGYMKPLLIYMVAKKNVEDNLLRVPVFLKLNMTLFKVNVRIPFIRQRVEMDKLVDTSNVFLRRHYPLLYEALEIYAKDNAPYVVDGVSTDNPEAFILCGYRYGFMVKKRGRYIYVIYYGGRR